MAISREVIWLFGVPSDRGNELSLMAAMVGYCSKYWGMVS